MDCGSNELFSHTIQLTHLYAKRYLNNHIDEKRVQELKRARQERIEKQ